MAKSFSDADFMQDMKLKRPFPSPHDWRDVWIYFLLVDRFNNPDKPPSPNNYPCGVYQGGTFEGIKQKLPYLKSLGVGALWLSPVLKNPGWFRWYWGGDGIMDFLNIEPRFCSDSKAAEADPTFADREFRNLVDAAHKLGIYVILDIVLNHVGDLFSYEGDFDSREWNPNGPYGVCWRDADGQANSAWREIEKIPDLGSNEGVWPKEFQYNAYFRRRGASPEDNEQNGDFDRLKELATDYPVNKRYPVRSALIRCYQYLIGKFDVDGFRIDTLQYVETEFARVFGNSMREYALSIGKKNFFTFGEVWQDDNEGKIAEFTGRNSSRDDGVIGVDAAIDFPMRKRLVGVVKGYMPPNALSDHYEKRRAALSGIITSHGEAGSHYITFLDNHDLNQRFHVPPWDSQTKAALALLFFMQGIPCVYYGTEQGLSGNGDRREYVREALWGCKRPFDEDHQFYGCIQKISALRQETPALRYGRQYFRPCSGDGKHFGFSPYPGGILAFSRILNDTEVLVVANLSNSQEETINVLVDPQLHSDKETLQCRFSSSESGGTGHCPIIKFENQCAAHVILQPMEVSVFC